MVTETLRRRGRRTRLIAGYQSAKDTILTNFAAPAAPRIWSEHVRIPTTPMKSEPDPTWMTVGIADETGARFNETDMPEGEITAIATPESLEVMLRSNWGPFAAGSFTLKTQVSQWLTLAWIENRFTANAERLVRIKDAWIDKLTISLAGRTGNRGMLILDGHYAGRRIDVRPLNALAGVVLPAAPMAPADRRKFRFLLASLILDPTGANVEMRVERLGITIDQGLEAEWTMTNGWDVKKTGKTRVSLDFVGNVNSETWDLIDKARAGTKKRLRVVATSDAPVKTLTMNFFETDFETENLGHDADRVYVGFRSKGQPHVSTTGDYITISLV